jgi:hypothetical protein
VRIKRKLNTDEVLRIMGHTSQLLADRCPDLLQVFPSSPCTNRGCPYAISQPGYLNCSFVAAEAGGEHTLDEIGDALELTRERVRQIEAAALRKFRERMASLDEPNASVHQSNLAAGSRGVHADRQLPERKNEADKLPIGNGRKLAQSRR